MTGQLTLWGAGQIIGSFFSKATAAPDTFYLALISGTAPSPYVSGSELDEPNKASYARVAIPNSTVYWSNGSQPQIALTQTDVPFVTATEDWGTLRYWALCNAQVDGFVYAVGKLDDVLVISEGDRAILHAGDLAVSIGPFTMEDT